MKRPINKRGGAKVPGPFFFLLSALVLMVLAAATDAVTPQENRYSRDGLSFSYPPDWPLTDESDANTQSISLDRGHNEAKIMVVVIRTQLNPRHFAEVQPKMTEAIASALVTEFSKLGAHAQRISISEKIGGLTAQGIRLQASLQGETGSADIFWVHLGSKLVHVIFVGSEQDRIRAAHAWNMICSSLRVNSSAIQPPSQAAASGRPGYPLIAGVFQSDKCVLFKPRGRTYVIKSCIP